ncbi:MAG: LptE family protein [Deltaproteobacteria bacterium]|nr:LptE family protein [Deltaproteobacteria bacterium]
MNNHWIKLLKYITAISLLALSACGYHLAGTVSSLPPDVKKIAIPLFSNKTLRPDIENQFTNALLDEFAKGKKVVVVGENVADAVVKGIITSFENTPISYKGGDVIQEYRVTVRLEVSLIKKADESVIWKDKNISYFSDYKTAHDIAIAAANIAEANRDAAIRKIAVDVARQLYSNILEGF